jgi:purine-binding chemotaxis protein CheW
MARLITQTETLLDPQRALQEYLDALLREVSPEADIEAAPEPAVIPVVTPAAASRKLDAGQPTPALEAPAAAQDRVIPDWAGERFQTLSFRVAGLTLAVPLIKLNGIVELKEGLTELPGYAPWVLGVLMNRGQKVLMIDIGQIVMPERSLSPPAEDSRHHYAVLINGGNFGLVADSLSQVLTLTAEDVRWRGSHSKRPWLAGTVIQQMCAILDIDALCRQLQTGLKG